jgi:hypothetical protein
MCGGGGSTERPSSQPSDRSVATVAILSRRVWIGCACTSPSPDLRFWQLLVVVSFPGYPYVADHRHTRLRRRPRFRPSSVNDLTSLGDWHGHKVCDCMTPASGAEIFPGICLSGMLSGTALAVLGQP